MESRRGKGAAGLSVEAFARKYLEEAAPFKSRTRYGELLRSALEHFGGLPLGSIKGDDVAAFRAKRVDHVSPHSGRPLSPTSVNRECAVLKAMFSYAARLGLLERNPVKGLKFFPEPQRNTYLSPEQENRLLAAIPDGSHLKGIVLLALHTGMRRGEILKLRWEQVDFHSGFLRLRSGQTKNADAREVPMDETVLRLLKGLTASRLRGPFVFSHPADRRVKNGRFVRKGQPIEDVGNAFQAACARVRAADRREDRAEGCFPEDFRFHDLRHVWASRHKERGTDNMVLMRLGGWRSEAMIRRYAYLTPDVLKQAARAADRDHGHSGDDSPEGGGDAPGA